MLAAVLAGALCTLVAVLAASDAPVRRSAHAASLVAGALAVAAIWTAVPILTEPSPIPTEEISQP